MYEEIMFKDKTKKKEKTKTIFVINDGIRIGDIRWDSEGKQYVFDDGEIMLTQEQLYQINTQLKTLNRKK
jgi:hypothetical protein